MPGDHPPTDAELIAQVRAGDSRAYGPLYERHRAAALRVARHFARDEAAAEDLTAEAFTRVLAAIDRGDGPGEAFRPYLYTTLRRTAFDWGESSRRIRLVEDISELEVTAAAADGEDRDPLEVAFDRQLAAQAFHSLPERWQIVLWHLEVEGESPADVAPLLDLSAGAVSALAYRAREGLRQAFLQAHLAETVAPTCRPHAARLAAFVRGRLGSRPAAQVERHLDTCADCTALYLELLRFNESLGEFVGPLVFGSAAALKIGATLALGSAATASGAAVTATGAVVGGSGAAGVAGAAGDAVAKTLGIFARLLMKARGSARTQTLTAAGTIVAACAVLAYALSGSPAGPPPTEPAPSSPSLVAVAPAPVPVATGSPAPTSAPPAWHPPAPRPRPRRGPAQTPTPQPSPAAPTPVVAQPSEPVPSAVEPGDIPEPDQTAPPAGPSATTPPGTPPTSPSPRSPSAVTTEPAVCRKAREALRNPTYQNIGLILAARWDPRCLTD